MVTSYSPCTYEAKKAALPGPGDEADTQSKADMKRGFETLSFRYFLIPGCLFLLELTSCMNIYIGWEV